MTSLKTLVHEPMVGVPPITHSWRRPFMTVWVGQSVSLFTSDLAQFGLVWWLVETTGSAVALSALTALALVPRIVLGPIAGALVDRWNRKTVMVMADTVSALALLALGVLVLLSMAEIWHVYLVVFIRALAGTFQAPAFTASTSLMVPSRHLPRVAGLNQLVRGLSQIGAPPLGAVLFAVVGLPGIIALDVGGAAVAIALLLVIAIPRGSDPHAVRALRQPGARFLRYWGEVLSEVRDGWRYIRRWSGASQMLALSMSVNALSQPAFILISIVTTRHLGGTVREFGWMGTALGVGIAAGGILLGLWGGFNRQMRTSLTGVVTMGGAILMIGLAPANQITLVLAGMALGGVAIPISMGPIYALIQQSVQPAMQGRVLTTFDSLSTLVAPIGLLIAAPVFDGAGTQIWYLVAGPLVILIGLAGFLTRTIRDLGSPTTTLVSLSSPP